MMLKIVLLKLKVISNYLSIITKERNSQGLRIGVDNREWWESLKSKIQNLSILALKKLAKPYDFIFIKTSKSGYSNVHAKVHENSYKFASLLEDGRDLIPIKELIKEEWYGVVF